MIHNQLQGLPTIDILLNTQNPTFNKKQLITPLFQANESILSQSNINGLLASNQQADFKGGTASLSNSEPFVIEIKPPNHLASLKSDDVSAVQQAIQ